jgi:hypothetical protein
MVLTSPRKLLPWLLCLACWLIAIQPAWSGPETYFPEKPPGMLIDKAGVLLPEKAAALNDDLLAEAQRSGIWVYVLTLASLDVRPSLQHDRLSKIAHYYVDLWARDRLAIVILFDDESSDAVVAASPELDRQFAPWSRNMRLSEPLARIVMSKELTREKVDKAARLTLATLVEMKHEAQAEARQKKRVKIGMLIFFMLAGAAIIYGSLRKKRGTPTAEASQSSSTEPTAEKKADKIDS